MESTKSVKKPTFSSQALFDINSEKLDVDDFAEDTIKSVVERGNSKDLSELIRYYGTDKIKTTIENSDYLLPRTLHLAKTLFGLHIPESKISVHYKEFV